MLAIHLAQSTDAGYADPRSDPRLTMTRSQCNCKHLLEDERADERPSTFSASQPTRREGPAYYPACAGSAAETAIPNSVDTKLLERAYKHGVGNFVPKRNTVISIPLPMDPEPNPALGILPFGALKASKRHIKPPSGHTVGPMINSIVLVRHEREPCRGTLLLNTKEPAHRLEQCASKDRVAGWIGGERGCQIGSGSIRRGLPKRKPSGVGNSLVD